MKVSTITAATGIYLTGALAASACVSGAKCVEVPADMVATGFAAGDQLPRGQYQMLMNSEYYGLPPVDEGTRYFRVDGRVMKVRPDTLEVIEDVTALANAAF